MLRNALLPVSTTIGLQTGLLLAGAVLTEKVFNWGGIGTLIAEGIERRDYPRLQAIVLLGAFVAQSSVGKVAPAEIPITDEVPESVRG